MTDTSVTVVQYLHCDFLLTLTRPPVGYRPLGGIGTDADLANIAVCLLTWVNAIGDDWFIIPADSVTGVDRWTTTEGFELTGTGEVGRRVPKDTSENKFSSSEGDNLMSSVVGATAGISGNSLPLPRPELVSAVALAGGISETLVIVLVTRGAPEGEYCPDLRNEVLFSSG